jgi:hypothetical protein
MLKTNRRNLRTEGGNGVEIEPRATQMAKQQPAINRGCERPTSDDAPIITKHSQVIAIPMRGFLIRDAIGPNAESLQRRAPVRNLEPGATRRGQDLMARWAVRASHPIGSIPEPSPVRRTSYCPNQDLGQDEQDRQDGQTPRSASTSSCKSCSSCPTRSCLPRLVPHLGEPPNARGWRPRPTGTVECTMNSRTATRRDTVAVKVEHSLRKIPHRNLSGRNTLDPHRQRECHPPGQSVAACSSR